MKLISSYYKTWPVILRYATDRWMWNYTQL